MVVTFGADLAKRYDAWFKTPRGAYADRWERKLIFKFLKVKPGERVLDVGCGTGHFTDELARQGVKITGIDPAPEMLNLARKKFATQGLTADFKKADAETLPFPDESFDAVMSITALEFVPRPERALAEMWRVLKPGGQVVVGVLNRWSIWAAYRRIRGLFSQTIYNQAHFIAPSELIRLIQQTGFKNIKWEGTLFAPPFNHPTLLYPFNFLEETGRRLIPGLGAFLLAAGQK